MRQIDIGELQGYEEYAGRYIVYDDGRVWSNSKKMFLVQRPNEKGYLSVDLWLPGDKYAKHAKVSRLVALGFIPNPEGLPQVGHDDDNKENNHYSNLYWTDAKENNSRDSHMRSFRKRVYCVELEQEFESVTAAAAAINSQVSNLCCHLKGRALSCGKHPETGEKLHWRYVE